MHDSKEPGMEQRMCQTDVQRIGVNMLNFKTRHTHGERHKGAFNLHRVGELEGEHLVRASLRERFRLESCWGCAFGANPMTDGGKFGSPLLEAGKPTL